MAGLILFVVGVLMDALALAIYLNIAKIQDEHDREQAYYEFGAFSGFIILGPSLFVVIGLCMMVGG
jgi:uncharacterized membrane protein